MCLTASVSASASACTGASLLRRESAWGGTLPAWGGTLPEIARQDMARYSISPRLRQHKAANHTTGARRKRAIIGPSAGRDRSIIGLLLLFGAACSTVSNKVVSRSVSSV